PYARSIWAVKCPRRVLKLRMWRSAGAPGARSVAASGERSMAVSIRSPDPCAVFVSFPDSCGFIVGCGAPTRPGGELRGLRAAILSRQPVGDEVCERKARGQARGFEDRTSTRLNS